MSTAREFQVFAKPAGARCNLRCRYCYYHDPGDRHAGTHPTAMSGRVLERYIAQHLEAASTPVVAFAWHGGEPTVLGLEYFQALVALQRRLRPPDRRIVNGVQTNGVLLDRAWCRFLASEGFRVGLSLDGPSDLHDRHRVTRGGEPTHAGVVRAYELLREHRVPCEILCVVHEDNVRQPIRVYRFFKSLGARAIGFLPLVVRSAEDAERAETPSVAPEAYGEFLCTIFDEWVCRDTGRIEIQMFDEATRPARGLPHSLCVFRETCGDVPIIEADGTCYACDHFADPAHRLGNILDTSLADMIESPVQRAFGRSKRDRMPACCRRCPVLSQCNGGCPKDRFARSPDGEDGLNYLCPSFTRFFTHVQPFAAQRAAAERGRLSLAALAADDGPDAGRSACSLARATGSAPGRNDACPCGSGRKYKNCCLRAGS